MKSLFPPCSLRKLAITALTTVLLSTTVISHAHAEELFMKAMQYHGNNQPKKAVTFMKKAAEQGEAKAMYNLGVFYFYGINTKQDYQQALAWYSKAADTKEDIAAQAMSNIGYMYDEGLGVPQDYDTALQWYKKAAALENADGFNNIGNFYQNGTGVPQDYNQATKLFIKAIIAYDDGIQDNPDAFDTYIANLKGMVDENRISDKKLLQQAKEVLAEYE